MEFKDWQGLRDDVQGNEDILAVPMASLRNLVPSQGYYPSGSARTGPNVKRKAHEELASRDLYHFPDPLPRLGKEWLYVVRNDTAMARLFDSVRSTNAGADLLNELVRSQYTAEVGARALRTIAALLRALVQDPAHVLLSFLKAFHSKDD